MKKPNVLERYFKILRFSSNHLGMGDIRLTIGQQEDIVNFFKKQWLVNYMICPECGYDWRAMYHYGSETIECPECRQQVEYLIYFPEDNDDVCFKGGVFVSSN